MKAACYAGTLVERGRGEGPVAQVKEEGIGGRPAGQGRGGG